MPKPAGEFIQRSPAGFKGWAREGGEWEGREGSIIKGEAEGVRKGGEGGRGKKESSGKVKRGKGGSFTPTAVFKSRRLRGRACRQVSAMGPRVGKRRPWPFLCLQALLPDNTPRMQYYVELTSLSYTV